MDVKKTWVLEVAVSCGSVSPRRVQCRGLWGDSGGPMGHRAVFIGQFSLLSMIDGKNLILLVVRLVCFHCGWLRFELVYRVGKG